MNSGSIRSRAKRALEVATDWMTVDLPEGLGGIDTTFDQVESLADYANAEFRLAIAEGL